MDPMLVISPHLDDAVLSVGQLLAGRPDAVVCSVFTGYGDPNARTTYDRDCGFSSAAVAASSRAAEDLKALRLVNARPVHLGYVDQQYRIDGQPDDDVRRANGIAQVIDGIEGPPVLTVVGPLGLKHPDHHRTRRAVQLAARARQDRVDLWLYEDLPSRVLWPEEVPDALAWWAGMGWDLDLDFLGTGPLDVKQKAVAAYRSQMWALDRHAILCPERLWKATPCS